MQPLPEEPLSDDEQAYADLKYGLLKLRNAEPDYLRAVDFANGKMEEFESLNARIRVALERSSKSYVFKLAGVPLRVMNDRIQLTGITVDKAAQKTWDGIAQANNLKVWAKELHRRAFKFGDAYMRAWPEDAPDSGGAEDADVIEAGVTLSYLDPRFTRVIYDPQDERRPLYAISTWTEKNRDWAQLEYRHEIRMFSKLRGGQTSAERYTNNPDTLARQQSIGVTQDAKWEPTDYVKLETQADGSVEEIRIPAVQPNEWQEITVKHFRMALPYGVPEHSGAYGPSSAIAKLLITQLATVDTQGWKTRYGLIDPAGILDNAGELVDWDDDGDSPTLDEQKRRARAPRRSKPGEMEIFDNLKEVGEWSASDPKVFTDPVLLYMKIMAVTTATPFYSFDPGGDAPSGRSREIEDEPLNAKCDDREAMLDTPWIELARLALRMVGVTTKECSPKWKPHTLATNADDWTTVKAQQEAGVPLRESLIMAGQPAEQVDGWVDDKNKMSVSVASVELLGALGDALQRMSTAVDGNLIARETAQGIIATMLDQFVLSPPAPELVAQTEEADARAAVVAEQVAAGTHDTGGNPIKPDSPSIKTPAPVGESTKQAAADNGKGAATGGSTKKSAADNGAPKG